MNRRNSRSGGSRNQSSHNKGNSVEDIYQLGYSHGFKDASNEQEYDDDYDEEEFDDYDDYDEDEYGNRYQDDEDDDYEDNRGRRGSNVARDNQGRFTSDRRDSNSSRSSRVRSGSNASRGSTSRGSSGGSKRGFAAMSKADRSRIAAMGGHASHSGGRSSGRTGFGGRRSS